MIHAYCFICVSTWFCGARAMYLFLIHAYSVYGVATISRLLKIIGLFCKRALQKRPVFSKETYNFKEPTNRSHPICLFCGARAMYRFLQFFFPESDTWLLLHVFLHDSVMKEMVSAYCFKCVYIHADLPSDCTIMASLDAGMWREAQKSYEVSYRKYWHPTWI